MNNGLQLFLNIKNTSQINNNSLKGSKKAVYKRLCITVYKDRKKRNSLTWSVQTENVQTRKFSIGIIKILKVAITFFDCKNI